MLERIVTLISINLFRNFYHLDSRRSWITSSFKIIQLRVLHVVNDDEMTPEAVFARCSIIALGARESRDHFAFVHQVSTQVAAGCIVPIAPDTFERSFRTNVWH